MIEKLKTEVDCANVRSRGSIIQLLGSYRCNLGEHKIKLYAMHTGRMNDCAIALCNVKSQDEHSKFALTLFENNGAISGTSHYYPLIFTPSDFGIKPKKEIVMLSGFATWCHGIGIKNIFINGHFSQQRSKRDGRGFIRGSDDVIIHTMDIRHALADSFIRGSLDFINML